MGHVAINTQDTDTEFVANEPRDMSFMIISFYDRFLIFMVIIIHKKGFYYIIT